MSFIEYLINKGYKPYRKIYNRSTKEFDYIEDDIICYFSSAVGGYTDIRLIKDNEDENNICLRAHSSDHESLENLLKLYLETCKY